MGVSVPLPKYCRRWLTSATVINFDLDQVSRLVVVVVVQVIVVDAGVVVAAWSGVRVVVAAWSGVRVVADPEAGGRRHRP